VISIDATGILTYASQMVNILWPVGVVALGWGLGGRIFRFLGSVLERIF
jgi:hypothetical protein